MKYLKKWGLFESLLDLQNNVDKHLIYIIESNVKNGGRILEVSCGNGADSLYLKELGYSVKCTEFNKDFIENAKKVGLDCIDHDTRNKFPFSDNEFDLVYSRLGLHYFTESELDSIFKELSRIGNKLLITVKIEEDEFKTGKIILSPEKWSDIINKYYDIELFNIKEGNLYGKPSRWIEILAK